MTKLFAWPSPFLLGGVATLCVLGLTVACNQKGGDTITAETSGFRPTGAKDGTKTAEVPTKAAAKPAGEIPLEAPVAPAVAEKVPGKGADAKNLTPVQKLLAEYDALDQRAATIAGPQGKGPQDPRVEAELLGLLQAGIDISDKILALPDAGEARYLAIQRKSEILQALWRNGNEKAKDQLIQFGEELAADKNARTAELGRMIQLAVDAENFGVAFAKLPSENNAPPVLDDGAKDLLKKLTARVQLVLGEKEATHNVFNGVLAVARELLECQQNMAAADILESLGARFETFTDVEIQFQAGKLVQQAPLVRLSAAMNDPTVDVKKVVDALCRSIAASTDESERSGFDNYRQAFFILEVSGHLDDALRLAQTLKAKFGKASDPMFAGMVNRLADTAEIRLKLVGQALDITGQIAGGGKFDWAKYRGKVVLIDCWASWCGPCKDEIPNVLEAYNKYHAKGLEVVGINFDEDPEDLARFFSSVPDSFQVPKLPWVSVVQDKPENSGMEADPNAKALGVNSIPFMLLVDRDGKVVATQTRGPKLMRELAKLFPEDAKPEAPEKKEETKQSSLRPKSTAGFGSPFVAFEEPKPEVPAVPPPAIAPALPADPNAAAPEDNPYKADAGLSVAELVDFLFDMHDKPNSIRTRPGFTEAICDAADRVLAGKPSEKFHRVAATMKFEYLHRDASLGNEAADKKMKEFAIAQKDCAIAEVADWVKLVQFEAETSDKMEAAQVPAQLAKLKEFFDKQTLENKHLRLASLTVGIINKLDEGKVREQHFVDFGKTFAKSSDKQLARYGKKLATPPEAPGGSELVGKPIELKGNATDSKAFKWDTYRGKPTLVVFWATWCPHCIKKIPDLEALYEDLNKKGFEIVGVSLDDDEEELAKFLEDKPQPWRNIGGEDAQESAKKLGIHAIPAMLLIDKDGKVIAPTSDLADVRKRVEKLLGPAAAEKSEKPEAKPAEKPATEK